ncbi:MAG: MoaD/ThiS family protein [Candidatus Abyssobacteria bacterium SURF_5]|uniref:MoaD/ThiS family protein n=1 Tax=Abyssobacteria bacterium (strain SURF_5) TaxID=2093360 RepID=A0A3A4NUF3_ABYX5|nr:MAG: MoaD/ThiS family protein [Candidatus Abyssubacteria bacterium SURF_5]
MQEEQNITVFVKLYAILAKYAGVPIMHQPLRLEIPAGTRLLQLFERLGIPDDEVKTAFVNSTMQPPEYVLREGDHVGIFPPVGGGATEHSVCGII